MRVVQTNDIGKLDEETQLAVYNGLDCCVTFEIYEKLLSLMEEKHRNARQTYDFSRAMLAPAMEMMQRGIAIDPVLRMDLATKFQSRTKRLVSIFAKITLALCDKELNPSSPAQLQYLFYEVLRIPPVYVYDQQRKLRRISVNREALEKLQFYYSAKFLVSVITSIRDTTKKLQVITSGIDADGRMRCGYNVVGTETGRWSSSKNVHRGGTNNQNITDEMRQIFVPDQGWKLGYADLQQAESKAVAYLSGDAKYIEACNSGDPHTYVAKILWPKLPWTGDPKKDKVFADETMFYRHFSYRDMAKRGGHAANYYGTEHTLSKNLKIDYGIAKSFLEIYFASFPGISEWQKSVARRIAKDRFITTALGRKRYFFGDPYDRETVKEAIAFEPQSLIGDILNHGLYAIWDTLREVQILAQVHDAILFQFPLGSENDILPRVLSLMKIPVLVNGRAMVIGTDVSIGFNWRKVRARKDGTVDNPNGLRKWTPNEPDTREPPAPTSVLDCRVS